jgi:hypothetical protein
VLKVRGIRWAAFCSLTLSSAAFADGLATASDEHSAGSGSMSLAYQSIEVNKFNTGDAKIDLGEVLTHSLLLEVNYALTDRWQISASIPYLRKKYDGPAPHDPLTLVPPRPEVPFVDDGQYHNEWQDFVFGASYLWINEPVIVEPFANLTLPSHDYPFFAQAAVGQDLWKAEFGVDVTKYMPFSNWFYQGAVSYTVVEKTLGVNVNHYRVRGQAGYFFTPHMSASAFVLGKIGNGNDASEFPPSARTDEAWYQHDRTSRHSYIDVGVGTDWYINDDYMLSVSALTSVWGKTVHMVHLAWTVGVTRYF